MPPLVETRRRPGGFGFGAILKEMGVAKKKAAKPKTRKMPRKGGKKAGKKCY